MIAASCGGGSAPPQSVAEPGPTAEPTAQDAAPTVEPAATDLPEPAVEATAQPEPTAEPSPTAVVLPDHVTRPSNPDFAVHLVSDDADGPAGAEPADMDGDGDLDLVVNFFGDRGPNPGPTEFPPGGITIFVNNGSLDDWTPQPVLTREDGVYFPNEALPRDIDGDGDMDLMVAGGFFVCEFNLDLGPCGALFWLEQTDDGWDRHDIVASGSLGFYHGVLFADLDGDGIEDLVTVAEFQDDARGEWFKGTGEDNQWESEPHVMGQFGGSLPVLHDIDGDGDLDVASGEFFFVGASFSWLEQVTAPSSEEPDGVWERHVMSTDVGRTIQLRVIDDLFGDGVPRWIGSNHVNTVTGDPEPASGIYLVEPGDDVRSPWTTQIISSTIESQPTVGLAFQAAPGVFSYGDVDDDGDLDLAVAGDGDDRVFWLEQIEAGVFVEHVIAENFGQAAAAVVEDLDGDGDHELIFTGYETNEVLIFELNG